MQLTNAMRVIDEAEESEGSVSAASGLSGMERIFCDVFVANGGNGEEAAIAAGYAEGSAKVSACRLLCRGRVAARIEFLCKRFMHAQLPAAIHTVLAAAGDEKALWKDRLKAATCILDRGGMSAPKEGPTINVGVQVNGQQAQALISSVWTAKERRLSDIPPAMPDTLQSDLDDIERLTIDAQPTTPGGDQLQGPAAGSAPVPPPAAEHCDETDVSRMGRMEPTSWRQAAWRSVRDAGDPFRGAFDDDSQGEDDDA